MHRILVVCPLDSRLTWKRLGDEQFVTFKFYFPEVLNLWSTDHKDWNLKFHNKPRARFQWWSATKTQNL